MHNNRPTTREHRFLLKIILNYPNIDISMAIGGVSQPLYIRGLPPGVGMIITDVQFNIPNFGSWTPSLQNIPGGYNIGKKTTVSPPPAQPPTNHL
jgi:hypothetical protein